MATTTTTSRFSQFIQVEPTERVSKQQHRRVINVEGPTSLVALTNTLTGLRTRILSQSFAAGVTKESLEIEARVGICVLNDYRRAYCQQSEDVCVVMDSSSSSSQFASGVDESFARRILLPTLFSSRGQFELINESNTRVLTDSRSQIRCEVDAQGNILARENKRKFAAIDHALLRFEYDVRIGLAAETPANSNEQRSNVAQQQQNIFTGERIKYRKTFRSKNSSTQQWKIDYTEVIANELDPKTGERKPALSASPSSKLKTIEFELELEKNVLLEWLQEAHFKVIETRTQHIASSLLFLLSQFIPQDSEGNTFQEAMTPISPIPDSFRSQINAINNRLGFGNNNNNIQFIGSRPLNMNRRNFTSCQQSSYYFTEKSDGLRSLLYVIKDNNNANSNVAVLVSRSKEVKLFRISGGDLIGEAFGVGTVLDGELVNNLSFHRTVFLVFDVLSIENKSIVQEPFSRRLVAFTDLLKHSGQRLLELYSRKQQQQQQQQGDGSKCSIVSSLPLELIRKSYYTNINELLSKIQSSSFNSYVYKDSDRRHHHIDGIICQPDLTYVFGNDPNLLKWKYPSLRSVDLEAVYQEREQRVQLFCDGPDGVKLDITKRGTTDWTIFGRFDQLRLFGDIHSPLLVSNQRRIIEVMFDTKCGCWTYLKFRKDKDEPNYIDTVVGVLMEQGEDISLEELQLTLMPKKTLSPSQSHQHQQPINVQELLETKWTELKSQLVKQFIAEHN